MATNNFPISQRKILLDISLFVLDMLSPEKIKSKYSRDNDEIILEVPSALITMIVDAQVGNSLLKQFIRAYLYAFKKNPIHKNSQDLQIQNIINADELALEEIINNVHKTILTEFTPLIRNISKIDQASESRDDQGKYPIQLYEPLVPVSPNELHNLRQAYWHEIELSPHPLFDVYFLQIYHAQSVFSEATDDGRELLSVGLTTYKTIRVWRYAVFGKKLHDQDEIIEKRDGKKSEMKDRSLDFLRWFASSYFRKKWENIVDDAVGLGVELALTFARTGAIGLQDVAMVAVTIQGAKLIAKGIKDKDSPILKRLVDIVLGVIMIGFVCLFSAPLVMRFIENILTPSSSIVPLPTIIMTIQNTAESTPVFSSTQDLAIPQTNIVQSTSTPNLIYTVTQISDFPNLDYCMYLTQPGDTTQTVAIRFGVSEVEVRYPNNKIPVNTVVANQIVRVNSSCCYPVSGGGISYTVQYKDDLLSISRLFSVSIDKLVQANNLYNPSYIQGGQMLCIPNT